MNNQENKINTKTYNKLVVKARVSARKRIAKYAR